MCRKLQQSSIQGHMSTGAWITVHVCDECEHMYTCHGPYVLIIFHKLIWDEFLIKMIIEKNYSNIKQEEETMT